MGEGGPPWLVPWVSQWHIPYDCMTHQALGMQALMKQDAGFVQPAARRNEVLGWAKEGLLGWCHGYRNGIFRMTA